jgi:hypothetical protein
MGWLRPGCGLPRAGAKPPARLLATSAAAVPPAPIGHAGRWLTDADGRVLLVTGVNMVNKLAPYAPDADGFGADDAAFLAANGFDAVRLGVIWKAVEPEPEVFDDSYLARIAATVNLLGSYGIVSLLDFHQDMYNEEFQGEGAPDWAVDTSGLLAFPELGFPANYFLQPALQAAYDNFWANTHVDGEGLQDWYAGAWQHVAAYFAGNPNLLGYDDAHAGFSFHDYCPFASIAALYGLLCPSFNTSVFSNADAHSSQTGDALLLTEFGATDDTSVLSSVVADSDGSGTFPAGAQTTVAVPAIQYPSGYQVVVTGATVLSATGILQLASCPGATQVSLTVQPGTGVSSGC